MSSNEWLQELDKMLTEIEREATHSLRNITKCFKQSDQSFHQSNLKYCLQRSIYRLKEVYSTFKCERQRRSVKIAQNLLMRNPIPSEKSDVNAIQISDDETSDSEKFGATAFYRKIKNKDKNESNRVSVEEIPNVATKEETLDDDDIPMVQIPVSQLSNIQTTTLHLHKRIKREKDENYGESIKKNRKHAQTNLLNISNKNDDNSEKNVRKPYRKSIRTLRKRILPNDKTCNINDENNANKANKMDCNIPAAVVDVTGSTTNGQRTLDKWISRENKRSNIEYREKDDQTKKKKTKIQQSHKKPVKVLKTTKRLLNRHNHQCHICLKRFSQKVNLSRHMMTHQDNLFHCPGCFRGFLENIEKEAHEKLCEKRRYECYICNRNENKKKLVTIRRDTIKTHMRIHTGERPHHCDRCKKRCVTAGNLKTHMLTHTKVKLFECDQCQKRFSTKLNLKRHMKIHTGEKPYQCHCCSMRFSRNSGLKIHILRIHRDDQFHCSGCFRGFSGNIEKEAHEKFCEKRRYECYICNRDENKKKKLVSTSKGEIKIHMKIHTGDKPKPHKCKHCNKQYNSVSKLKIHVRTHTGERPYQCEYCQKRFTYLNVYKMHIITHTGEKQFQCDQCQKRFKNISCLKMHQRTHTGEKPYQCDRCLKRFRLKEYLIRHMRTHRDNLFHCSGCYRGFSENIEKEAHEKDCKIRRYECYVCNRDESKKKFVFNRSGIKNHMRIHTGEKPHKCKFCNKRFIKNSDLITHIRIHTGEKPYQCDHCLMRFSALATLKNHIQTHTGEKPHHCQHCLKRFRNRFRLSNHMRTHQEKETHEKE